MYPGVLRAWVRVPAEALGPAQLQDLVIYRMAKFFIGTSCPLSLGLLSHDLLEHEASSS